MTKVPVYAVIMAGGQGKRLWPLSRQKRPKQFLSLSGNGQSLLQESVRRARVIVGSIQQVLVVTQSQYAELVRDQLPELPERNLVLEPDGRNTAACLGLAAMAIKDLVDSPEDNLTGGNEPVEPVMIALPADHIFKNETPWFSAVRAAIFVATQGRWLVTIGIPPTQPSSNYGYLQLGEAIPNELADGSQAFIVRQFIEKPEIDLAKAYFQSGEYLWNTGTFAWQVSVFQEALKRHLPGLHHTLEKLDYPIDPQLPGDAYASIQSISVDYGVLEKAENVVVVRGNFERIDVGSLANLAKLWSNDDQNNAIIGAAASRDSQDNIVFTDQGLVGLIGVRDLVVVRAGDVVLVCSRERANEVKALIESLSPEQAEKYL